MTSQILFLCQFCDQTEHRITPCCLFSQNLWSTSFRGFSTHKKFLKVILSFVVAFVAGVDEAVVKYEDDAAAAISTEILKGGAIFAVST